MDNALIVGVCLQALPLTLTSGPVNSNIHFKDYNVYENRNGNSGASRLIHTIVRRV
jgi:hypothetical protein